MPSQSSEPDKITKPFRVSSDLKDIIGRDLIVDDLVAIFELVKNSYDARATRIDVEFSNDKIVIVDDGKGMSRESILSRWLFVAYSAKKDGTEEGEATRDYRDAIGENRRYAGNKGIGRFSCDRLGETLELYSTEGGKNQPIQRLDVNWALFEEDSKREFGKNDLTLSSVSEFPTTAKVKPPSSHGTMLVIRGLRSSWPPEKIEKLRASLAKLVDPFESGNGPTLATYADYDDTENLNGPVGNEIIDVLKEKTTRLIIEYQKGGIHSWLYDRGVLIYHIKEACDYPLLDGSHINAQLFYLNRSAKQTFSIRMGLSPVSFGNIFLFINGFRVYPVGEPTVDTFGIARRKQQGHARYFGLRDLLGKIEISAPTSKFREASSRDSGLIGPEARALETFTMEHLVKRLERYVVPVTWADSLDSDRDTVSGLRSDAGRARIINVIRKLAGAKDITLVDFDRELVDVVNERSQDFEEAMTGLRIVAEESGDKKLLERIQRSQKRYEELKKLEAEARSKADAEAAARKSAERRADEAEDRATRADDKRKRTEAQNKLLIGLQGKDEDQLTLLHHQAIIYATEVSSLVRRSLKRLKKEKPDLDEVARDLEQISFQNSRILAVSRFATQVNFELRANELDADILQFLNDYAEEVASRYEGEDRITFERNGLSLNRTFKPIDVAIVMDNLASNSAKAKADHISLVCRKPSTGNGIEIVVSDNGRGISNSVDETKIFDKAYSGTKTGSGLGLYHIRQVLEDLGGSIELDPKRESNQAKFVMRLPKGGKNEA